MANAVEQNQFDTAVRLIEPGDSVVGGAGAPINQPLQALANRTLWLKNQTAAIQTATVGKADAATAVKAGSGLTGGGSLAQNRTIALGAPGQITAQTQNAVQETGHTHAIDTATTSRAGIVMLDNDTGSAAEDRAATPKAVKTAYDKAVAAASAADGAVKTRGNQEIGGVKTFTSKAVFNAGLTVFGNGKSVDIHSGQGDIYLRNSKSNKYLQLKDDGTLTYSDVKIALMSDKSDAVNLDSTDSLATSKAVKTAYDNSIRRGGAVGLGGQNHQIAIGWDTPGLVAKVDNTTMNVGVPTGAIAYFVHAVVPFGWLKANGAAVSRTVYANLFALIGTTYGAGDGRTTFNLPDLRGEFIRSWDDGRGIDPGRGHASQQSGNVASHRHATGWRSGVVGNEFSLILGNWARVSNVTSDVASGIAAQNFGEDDPYNHVGGITYQNGSDHYTTSREIYDQQGETRPRNIALMACIKA